MYLVNIHSSKVCCALLSLILLPLNKDHIQSVPKKCMYGTHGSAMYHLVECTGTN